MYWPSKRADIQNRIGLFLVAVLVLGNQALGDAVAGSCDEQSLEPGMPLAPAIDLGPDDSWPTLNQRMRRYGVRAASIAIIRDNRLAELAVIGSISSEDPTPITAATRFQAASLSKAVTALGVLALAGEGVIDLDQPAHAYLKTWMLTSPDNDPVTLAELLSHSGGVNVPSYPGFERGAEMPSLDDILTGAANAYSDPVAVTSRQGEHRYSGGGYQVLQKVIEDITGTPFESYMQNAVFQQAGARRSTFEVQNKPDGLAFGHDWSGKVLADRWQDYPQAAAAGLWSTPEDLARMLIAFGKSWRGESEGLMPKPLARRITHRTRTQNADTHTSGSTARTQTPRTHRTQTPISREEILPKSGKFSYSPTASRPLACFSSPHSAKPPCPCPAVSSSRWTPRRTITSSPGA